MTDIKVTSSHRNKLKLDFRTFSVLILIGIVPMLLGSWLLFRSYESAYLEMLGNHLSDTAETAFASINGHLQSQIIEVAALTEVPTLRQAVSKSNTGLSRNLEEIRNEIMRMEAIWPRLAADSPQARQILENPASQYLLRYINVNKLFRQIIVTDFLGRLVASTEKSKDYYLARQDWWKETYGDGVRGSVYIGDVRYDPQLQASVMDLAQPLVAPGGSVIGVIKAAVDLQGIHALTGALEAEPGTEVALIRTGGEVISAPGYTSLQNRTYPGTLQILEAREKQRKYFMSQGLNPPSVYGLSKRDFTEIYPHLNWMIVATGHISDVLGPLPQLRKYFVALVVGVFLTSILATLMISRIETKPVIEMDPHLERL